MEFKKHDLLSRIQNARQAILPTLCFFEGRKDRSTECPHMAKLVSELHRSDRLMQAIEEIIINTEVPENDPK